MTLTSRIGLLLLWLTLLAFPGTTETQAATAAGARPRVGLVLSGGGALGAAHVGVLKVLEELRIPVDVIAGTSMGAVVGGLYASGRSAAELERLIVEIDWNDLFKDNIPREERPFRRKQDDYNFLSTAKLGLLNGEAQLPTGLIQGQKLALQLRELALPVAGIRNFDQLPIRFRAVAADVETGKPVILKSGDLATAMRASMSVPGVFPPVEIDDTLLVDGGVANNLPMDVARAMGVEVLIVADLPSPLKKRDKLNSTFAIAGQMLSVLIQQNSQLQLKTLGPRDVYILPDLGDMTASDFQRMKDAVNRGEAAARKQSAALARLALPPAAFAADRAHHQPPPPATPVIAFIELDNRTRLSNALITKTLDVRTGETLDREKLAHGIHKLYGIGEFERIDYQVVERDGQTGLTVTAYEKVWAKNYFNFGLALSDNMDGDSSYNLAASLTLTALNELGAEWRNEIQIGGEPRFHTEFFQPLDPLREFFVVPELFYSKRNLQTDTPTGRAVYRVELTQATLAAGSALGSWGEVRAGYRRGLGSAALKLGSQRLSNFDFDVGEAFLRVSFDTLDNVKFPKEGNAAVVELVDAEPALGASSAYRTGVLGGNFAYHWDRNTVVFGAKAATSFDDTLPVEARFPLGGLFNLSGLTRNQLSGQQLLLGRMIYYRTLTNGTPDLFDIPIYAGASLEAGNIWESRAEVSLDSLRYANSLFIGADTYVGPLYLALGRANRGESAVYLFLGRTF
jgi:NTE family protein